MPSKKWAKTKLSTKAVVIDHGSILPVVTTEKLRISSTKERMAELRARTVADIKALHSAKRMRTKAAVNSANLLGRPTTDSDAMDLEDGSLHLPVLEDGTPDFWIAQDTESGEIEETRGEFDEVTFVEDFYVNRGREYSQAVARKRIETENSNWEILYDRLMHAYMLWDRLGEPMSDESTPTGHEILCIDIFEHKKRSFPTHLPNIIVNLMRFGYVANSPAYPSVAFSVRTLAFYASLSSRCANVGIQPFLRSILDYHHLLHQKHLDTALTRSFDVFLEILDRVERRIGSRLYPTNLDKHQYACPCCAFSIQDEPKLEFSMQVCIDGNESLKRHQQMRKRTKKDGDAGTEDVTRPDSRTRTSHLFVEAEYVDKFKNEVTKKRSSKRAADARKQIQEDIGGLPVDGSEKTPCVERWRNLADDSTKKMWGSFCETGIFIAACRHGSVLSICDMIRSGELAKYALALVKNMMETFGKSILIGYDIGCGFAATSNKSALIGPQQRTLNVKYCCNAFHGHAHCRSCQLQWHPLFTKGAGLEDFEGCERIFSESNRLAACTRHATAFHRRQNIIRYFLRWNQDKYGDCSRFIIQNYRQAHECIASLSTYIANARQALHIESDDVFEQWHKEELEYLKKAGSPEVDEQETIKTEYIQLLKKINDAEGEHAEIRQEWINFDSSQKQNPGFSKFEGSSTRTIESSRRHKLDAVRALEDQARNLEEQLGITDRWIECSSEWEAAKKGALERDFRQAIDRLEGLVVARVSEMSKRHQAGTGYKLRRQIAKGLQARSTAINSAVNAYNRIATTLGRPLLNSKTILEYVYNGQFDLLKLSQSNVLGKRWAQSAERAATNAFFKLRRAHEEIRRLDVEVLRLTSYMKEHHRKLKEILSDMWGTDPDLAFQIEKHTSTRRLQDILHLKRFKQCRFVTQEMDFAYLDGEPGNRPSSFKGDLDDDIDGGFDETLQESIDSAVDMLSESS